MGQTSDIINAQGRLQAALPAHFSKNFEYHLGALMDKNVASR